MTELRTDRLAMRRFTPNDAAFVLELLNEPGWIRNVGDRNVRTLDDARHYIDERFSTGDWLVVSNADGAPVGVCGLIKREGFEHTDIGYGFLARHSGKGYASEAARAVLGYARDVRGLPVVVAFTKPDNAASQRVLEKIGLRFVDVRQLPGIPEPSAYFTTEPE